MEVFSKNNRGQIIIAGAISLVLAASLWGGFFGVWRDKLVDLLFTAKPASGDIVIIVVDEASIQAIGQWPWSRSVFGKAIANLNSAKVIGVDVNFKEPSGRGASDDDYLMRVLQTSSAKIVLSSEIEPGGNLILPIEKFKAHSSQGYTNVVVAPDGIVRRFHIKQNAYPSFALEVGRAYERSFKEPPFYELPKTTRINYRGPNKTFTAVSFKDVFENKIPADFFRDKIVLIGATVFDLHDYHQTPFGLMSGAEVQANVIQTILDGAIFQASNLIDTLVVILLAFAAAILAFWIKSFAKLILAVVAILAVYNMSAFLGFDGFFILDLFYPNLAIILSAGASVAFQYITTYKEKKFIQDSFSRYLAPEVVNELIKDPSRLKLGGERKAVTILFSDIRGFTSISEKMLPEQLTKFMNRYL